MLAVNATHPKRRNHATAVGKPVISHAIALTLVLVAEELQVAQEGTLVAVVAEVARNATNAARLDTLPVTAPRDRTEEEVVVDPTAVRAKAVTVVAMAAAAALVKDRPVTLAADTATCLATARKVKSATIVSIRTTAFLGNY